MLKGESTKDHLIFLNFLQMKKIFTENFSFPLPALFHLKLCFRMSRQNFANFWQPFCILRHEEVAC